jgi:hypothetical protein
MGMESNKAKKPIVQKVVIDNTLSRFKNIDLFPEKTDKFNETLSRIGEDKFIACLEQKKGA